MAIKFSDSAELSEEDLRHRLKELLVKESTHENGSRILFVFDAVNQVNFNSQLRSYILLIKVDIVSRIFSLAK